MTLESILLKIILLIGLGALMGLERDDSNKSEFDKKDLKELSVAASKKFSFIKSDIPARGIGGVRTYILVSILGAISGLFYFYGMSSISLVISMGLILFLLISFILNYFDKNTLGLTTEVSIMINYLASLMLMTELIPAKIIVAIVVTTTLVVSMKSQVRSLVAKFSGKEVVDSTKFVLFTLVILPFLPNENFTLAHFPLVGDFFNEILESSFIQATAIFNPFKLWLVVVFIMSINFIGYYSTKLIGEKKSIHLIGLLGGMVSSTAVTEAMALQSLKNKSVASSDSLVTGAVLANISSFIRIVIIALFVNSALALRLMPSMFAMTLVMVLWLLYIRGDSSKSNSKKIGKDLEDLGLRFESPFSLKTSLAFGLLFTIVLFLSNCAIHFLGNSGLFVYSLIISMTGMDPVTLSIGDLTSEGIISVGIGLFIVVGASCMNLFAKMSLAAISSNSHFRLRIVKVFITTISVGLLVMITQFYLSNINV